MPGVVRPTTERKKWVCLYDFFPDGAPEPTHTLWVNARGQVRVVLGAGKPGKHGVESIPLGPAEPTDDGEGLQMQVVLPGGAVEVVTAPDRSALLMRVLARMAGRQVLEPTPSLR